ncbi:hypothetical protein ABG79_01284 [Caloramator mitchellensis]|uniref:Uncharacterized protein n=1 Tax=Caloramator mitchellensis TaxID=908809 RepID=A0A0R3JTE9_CALMK|nr:hypothetical protein [Caloramator mitchellensis]KRQ86793.1 hypothetical protein ABG79_01284 [Caloramator mitchellensis]
MLNRIRDRRIERNGIYELTLQIPEDEYFSVYDSVTEYSATEIVGNYLAKYQDDARFDNVRIKHNKNGHVVDIKAELRYVDNDHTDASPVPDMLNKTRP